MAASHLDAVTFQICSQSFKIMPTALFAVWLLGQYLAPLQWASLPVLALGVVFVTMNGSTPAAGAGGIDGESDLVLGLAASALSGLSSAYAGARRSLLLRARCACGPCVALPCGCMPSLRSNGCETKWHATLSMQNDSS